MAARAYSRCQALRERCHGGLARRGITVRRRAVFVMPERKRPQPRLIYRRSVGLHDAADHNAIGRHVVIVIISTRPDGREADARYLFPFAELRRQGRIPPMSSDCRNAPRQPSP